MTTLADLTPEERAECIGLWGNHTFWGQVLISITDGVKFRGVNVEVIRFIDGRPVREWASTSEVTPRPDLPRAWTPDGQPVPGEWEDGHVVVSYDDPDPWILKDAVSIEGLSEGGMSYYDDPPNGIEVKLDKFGEGEGKARRWVGSWEQA
ncbi:hypothetical protein KPA07_05215 [Corynebacterium aurimucosum]|uniref:hypothetical protein n=1 Tax=Corynebacterium aurimucosum TaxID=169292 RepID=UPI001C0F2851|nr:hypothetical protein [Corynebacterium aurimucosum]MBU5654313.1 hypothetical protein [Corynebacterium aurimucosum]